MSLLSAHPNWLAQLRSASDRPPRKPRLPLWWQDAVIGSVEPEVFDQIGTLPASGGRDALQKTERSGIRGLEIKGELTLSLALLADALRAAGLAHAWRDEQLAVTDAQGRMHGTVERAVVRVLGITTFAVHLVACSPDGRHWVQQRSLTKPNDPGLWDTLMGGLVPASDTLDDALARETWEEAGLHIETLAQLTWGGRLVTRGHTGDGAGAGYVVEEIDWFRCVVPEGMEPVNQDGEVDRFALLPPAELAGRLVAGEFTLEAGLVIAAAGL